MLRSDLQQLNNCRAAFGEHSINCRHFRYISSSQSSLLALSSFRFMQDGIATGNNPDYYIKGT
jgi:hypothetical protein